MSISTEIARILAARNKILTKLVSLGLAQPANKIDQCATVIEEIADNGAVSATIREGETYNIPAGYHNGGGKVSGVAGGGNYVLQSKTVTPTESDQIITPDSGKYGLSDVTVKAIPENYIDTSDGEEITGTIDGLTTTVFSIPAGYTTGGSVSLTGDIEAALAEI